MVLQIIRNRDIITISKLYFILLFKQIVSIKDFNQCSIIFAVLNEGMLMKYLLKPMSMRIVHKLSFCLNIAFYIREIQLSLGICHLPFNYARKYLFLCLPINGRFILTWLNRMLTFLLSFCFDNFLTDNVLFLLFWLKIIIGRE